MACRAELLQQAGAEQLAARLRAVGVAIAADAGGVEGVEAEDAVAAAAAAVPVASVVELVDVAIGRGMTACATRLVDGNEAGVVVARNDVPGSLSRRGMRRLAAGA